MSPRFFPARLSAQSDARLMALVAGGSERAFEALVKRYRAELLRYCVRMGLADSRAEDVLQHAFLQAWLALRSGPEVRELRPWLYRVVHNAAVNALRSSARFSGAPAQEAELGSTAGAESELERMIALRAALEDVAALPQMQREAILLSAVEGRSNEEVASALGVSSGAVRGLLYRARSTLRGAAAGLAPQPLVAWAHNLLGRASATVERLPMQGDGPAVLLKGAAVAATAALVVGATVAPSHPHRVRPAERVAAHRGVRAGARAGAAPVQPAASTTGGSTARTTGASASAGRVVAPSTLRAEALAGKPGAARPTPAPEALVPSRPRSSATPVPAATGAPTSSAGRSTPQQVAIVQASAVAPTSQVSSTGSSSGSAGGQAGGAGPVEEPAKEPVKEPAREGSSGSGGSEGEDSGSGDSGSVEGTDDGSSGEGGHSSGSETDGSKGPSPGEPTQGEAEHDN